MLTGKIHSFQSLGAADGPGVRFIVFFQGCPYRCPYCHNPDTRSFSGGTEYTAEQIIERASRFRPYFEAGGGGITASGGEPLMQAEFLCELFSLAHKNGINTCLDTAGVKVDGKVRAVLEHTDTVLCDIKFPSRELYKKHIDGDLKNVIELITLCRDMKINTVVRHVVVPGLSDSEESIALLKNLVCGIASSIKIELLPFRKLCVQKYKALGMTFPLENTPECSEETLNKLKKLL